jgi:hypothetical protein
VHAVQNDALFATAKRKDLAENFADFLAIPFCKMCAIAAFSAPELRTSTIKTKWPIFKNRKKRFC